MAKAPAAFVTVSQGAAHHDDHRTHSGVDVAEHPYDSGASESDGSAGPGRVQAEVEDLAAEAGEGVVEDRIEVGELHRCAGLDREHVRDKALAALLHAGAGGRARRGDCAPARRARATPLHPNNPGACARPGSSESVRRTEPDTTDAPAGIAAQASASTLKQIRESEVIVIVQAHRRRQRSSCAPGKLRSSPERSAPGGNRNSRRRPNSCRRRPR